MTAMRDGIFEFDFNRTVEVDSRIEDVSYGSDHRCGYRIHLLGRESEAVSLKTHCYSHGLRCRFGRRLK